MKVKERIETAIIALFSIGLMYGAIWMIQTLTGEVLR